MKRLTVLTFLVIFGLLTLFMSSSVLFDWFGIRAKEGNFVPAVVWANWVCGMLYLSAAFGILKYKTWSKVPLIISLLILTTASILLFIHINSGGFYETKTVGAMAFRTGVTAILLLTTLKIIKQ